MHYSSDTLMIAASSTLRQPDRTLVPALALVILLMYLLSSSWRFPLGGDGRATLATSRSLLVEHTLAIDPAFASDEGYAPRAKIGVDGRAYGKAGVGLPIGARLERNRALLWRSGFALAGAILTKPGNLVVAPAFALYVIASRERPLLREAIARLSRFGWPVAVCGVVLASMNWMRFGSI